MDLVRRNDRYGLGKALNERPKLKFSFLRFCLGLFRLVLSLSVKIALHVTTSQNPPKSLQKVERKSPLTAASCILSSFLDDNFKRIRCKMH